MIMWEGKDADEGPINNIESTAAIYLVGVDSTKRHDIIFYIENRSNIPIDNGPPSNTQQ